jgi:aryl-alcohol dehydrogenase-like predicted oxidoreductase
MSTRTTDAAGRNGAEGRSGRLATTRLGEDGPEVGVQGLGCMGMSWAYGPTDADEARATLERALELGVTLYDTANVYGRQEGDNEKFIAPFVQAHRDEIVVATKFALSSDPDDPYKRSISNDPAYIRECAENSLRRLGVETIDLYYMHRRDESVPLEESVGAMAELVREGKVRWLGLSEVTASELRTANTVHPITALQSEWSLFSRDVEGRVVDAVRETGTALVPYSPLGRGFLSGSFADAGKDLTSDDYRRTHPRFVGDNATTNAALLEPLREIAAEREATIGQIALAWVQQQARSRELPVVPIPGTRKRTRVEENVAATRIELTDTELALLEPIAAQVAGPRYANTTSSPAGRE